MVHIYKGNKKVDSFYLNENPIKYYFCKKDMEHKTKLNYLSMFPIRKNSCIWFPSESEAKEYIKSSITSIALDDRFDDDVKGRLIKYLESFTVSV